MSVRVTHIFRPFPMFFVSFCLSYIRFLLPVELPLNISCSTGSLTSNSPQLLFLWKNLPFSLFFEKYFHWVINSWVNLRFFLLHFGGIIALSSGFQFSFEKITISLIDAPLKVMSQFFLDALKTFVCRNFTITSLIDCDFFCSYPAWSLQHFFDIFHQFSFLL